MLPNGTIAIWDGTRVVVERSSTTTALVRLSDGSRTSAPLSELAAGTPVPYGCHTKRAGSAGREAGPASHTPTTRVAHEISAGVRR